MGGTGTGWAGKRLFSGNSKPINRMKEEEKLMDLAISQLRTYECYSRKIFDDKGYRLEENNERHSDFGVSVPTARVYSHGQPSAPIINSRSYIAARQKALSRNGGRK